MSTRVAEDPKDAADTLAESASPQLQHVVLLKFPEALSVADEAALRAMVATWPLEIGTMTELRFGADLTGERSRGYQYLLLTVFPDEQTLQDYTVHPTHLRFVEELDRRGCERLAVDYHLDETSRLL